MVGLVVVTHGNLGEALLETAEHILNRPLEQVTRVTVEWNDPLDEIEKKVRRAVKTVMGGEGVVVVTDMFGGTPSNISLAFVGEGPIAVVTGVNLPMVLVFFNHQHEYDYQQLALHMKKRGRDSIVSSLDVLPDLHVVSRGD